MAACNSTKQTTFTDAHREEINALQNKRWLLQNINGVTLPQMKQELYLSFKAGGSLQGFGGCNSFSGAWIIANSKLSLSNINATKMACERDSIEAQFLKTLTIADDFYIAGEDMQLFQKGKMIANFHALYIK